MTGIGIIEAVAITGLTDRKLREIAPTIPGAQKEMADNRLLVWRFDEPLLRGWVAGTVESNVGAARKKALSGRLPCDTYMRNSDMRAFLRSPNRVYFIGCDSGHVKIGLAFVPKTRLLDLQQGCPLKLTLLAEREGSRQVEMYLHEFYKAERVRGEWFDRSDRLNAYIERLAGQ